MSTFEVKSPKIIEEEEPEINLKWFHVGYNLAILNAGLLLFAFIVGIICYKLMKKSMRDLESQTFS